jgi:hypothetical protein
LEEGFKVTSVDTSDKMLEYALKTRWNHRKEEYFMPGVSRNVCVLQLVTNSFMEWLEVRLKQKLIFLSVC